MKATSARMPLLLSAILAVSAVYAAEDPDPVIGNEDWIEKDKGSIPDSIPKIDIQAKYRVVAELPKVPDSLLQFEIQRIDPTRINPSRDSLARVVDFEGKRSGVDKTEDGASSVLLTDAEGRTLEYFSSGAVFFMNEELFSEQAPDLFSVGKWERKQATDWYAAEAKSFLDSAGLVHEGMRFKDVSFMEVESMGRKDAEAETRTVGAAAHFGYSIDGIPAWGPGAKTTVYFDGEGISGVYDAIPDLKPAKAVAILSPETALESYMKSETPRSLYRLHTGAVEQVLIESVELVYYLGPGNRNQKTVSPHYLIRGTFIGKDVSDSSEKADGELKSDFIWIEPAV